MCVHQRHICVHSMQCVRHEGGRQGPHGGSTYMYTRKYTDQEKWSVNHITYIVVYIEQCSTKRGITGTMFLFYLLGVDMPHRMCKTIIVKTKMTLKVYHLDVNIVRYNYT